MYGVKIRLTGYRLASNYRLRRHRLRGKLEIAWNYCVKVDMKRLGFVKEDARNGNRCRSLITGNRPTSKKANSLTVLQININGIQSKIAKLQQLMLEENIGITIIEETKLHSYKKRLQISNYSGVRHDRKDLGNVHTGGGLIFYIKPNLPFVPTTSSSPQDIEYQSIKIPLTSSKCLSITNIYLPQHTASTNQQTENANIVTLLTQLFNILNSWICGDANAHAKIWYTNQTPDHRGDPIASLIQSSEHVFLNKNTPTRTRFQSTQKSTASDLTFISPILANRASWKTKTTLFSDHLLIVNRIDIRNKLNLEQINRPTQTTGRQTGINLQRT